MEKERIRMRRTGCAGPAGTAPKTAAAANG